MSNSTIKTAALRLRQASASGKSCAPIRELISATDVEQAYAIQQLNTEARVAAGARIVGRKIGLTAPAVQQQLGVDQPDFGMLFHDCEVLNNGSISMQSLMQPKVEAEIALVLGRDLTDQRLTISDIISAVDYALVSIEIVGSRVADWNIRIADTVADNASASHFVLGHQPKPLAALDLVNCKMQMYQNNKLVSEGIGKNCLGSPLNATLWLAQMMVKVGQPMRAGDLILTGALGPMINVNAGDHFSATIEGLGSVAVSFEA